MDIRSRIRQVLAEHPEWTPTSVSLKAGGSNSMLQKFLNPEKKGGIKSMTTDKIEAIAKALEVSPRWLMFGDLPQKLDPKVAYIFDHISAAEREQAIAILETFLKNGSDNDLIATNRVANKPVAFLGQGETRTTDNPPPPPRGRRR